MILPGLNRILETSRLRSILQSKELAQLGDFLANFIYSTARIGIFERKSSVHVWDKRLKMAMDQANLRKVLGKRTKPDKVADGAEALIAYAYYNRLLQLEEMIIIMRDELEKYSEEEKKSEKVICGMVFTTILLEIIRKKQNLNMPQQQKQK